MNIIKMFVCSLLFVGQGFAADILITPAWLAAKGSPPYILDQAGANYILDTDVTTDGSAFMLQSGVSNVSMDLASHTITYGNLNFTGVQNPGFEEGAVGDPATPVGWDLSGAHGHAQRQSYLSKLFYDSYSLRIDNFRNDAYTEESVLSSPVFLPAAGNYAITAEVQGGPWGVLSSSLAVVGISSGCSNSFSNMHTSYIGDMSWGLICEFYVQGPTTVRAKIVVQTTDNTRDVNLNVDEVDIRPIGFRGIGSLNSDYSMYEVKGGTVIEGQSKAIYSYGVATGQNVHNLAIITNGINSENIYMQWQSNREIYNNYLEANAKLPLNRQYYFSMINLGRSLGGNRVYNNTLMNGPHVGIALGDYDTSPNQKTEIYGNTIKTRVNATNGFAIFVEVPNVDIYNNTISPIQGHGIGLNRDADQVRIFNNIIEPRTWPCSEYAQYTYPNSAHGIRIKNYHEGVLQDLEIASNTITGGTNPQSSNCYTEVVGITNYLQDDDAGGTSSNVKIHDNIISVETDNYLQQHAIAYKGMGQGEFYNNTLTSNHILVDLSDGDVGGVTKYKSFYGNTLVKGASPQGFYTLRYGGESTKNNKFIGTTLQNGADLKGVSLGINNAGVSYSPAAVTTVSWNLTVSVIDNVGAVEGATVTVRDKNSVIISSGITNAAGQIILPVKEYTYSVTSSGSYQYVTPQSITAVKSGKTASASMSVIANSSVGLNLDTGGADTVPPARPRGFRKR